VAKVETAEVVVSVEVVAVVASDTMTVAHAVARAATVA
jgi:hypothetical protein